MADITPLKLTPEGGVARLQTGDVIPVANGGTGATTAAAAAAGILPSQTGHNGKVLSTDGTNISWSTAATGYTGSAGINGYTGSRGETGLGFSIAKTYSSVSALQADASPVGIFTGQFAIIETGDNNNAENSRLYLWNGSSYTYTTDLSGAAGITGATGYTGSAGTNGYTGSAGATQWAASGSDIYYSTGNIGIGVTPSATDPTYFDSLEIGKLGNGLAACNISYSTSKLLWLTGNCYVTYSSGALWKYGSDGYAARYGIEDGVHLWYTAPTGTTGGNITWNQTALIIDRSNNVLATGSGGLGYGPGSGGTVTQATSKSTAVTLNKPTGRITMNAETLAAGTAVQFAVGVSMVTTNDVVIVNLSGGISALANYNVWAYPYAGGFYCVLKNISAGSLSEAAVINFAIIKGATA